MACGGAVDGGFLLRGHNVDGGGVLNTGFALGHKSVFGALANDILGKVMNGCLRSRLLFMENYLFTFGYEF